MAISKELISVIVPCYNQAQYLDECLRSILDQTYENWECLIINDGSPDSTEEVAEKWVAKDKRFKYFYKENGGLSSARNYGIFKATGDWIQFLDCDDILEKEKFTAQTAFFNKGVDILVSGYRYFENDEGKHSQRIYGRNHFLPEVCLNISDVDIVDVLSRKNPFVISAPLYSKEIFEKVGVFNENLSSLEDWEFNLRCGLNDLSFLHTGYNNEDKTLIRLHEESMMRNEGKMAFNYRTFVNICNTNPLYINKIGSRNIPEKKRVNYLALFIPPIILLILRKLRYSGK